MAEYTESICRRCFHSYVCEQFNGHRNDNNKKCHFFNDHFVPAADVAPVRHGRWVVGKDHGDFGEAKCTACGGILLVKWSDRLSEYRYCPNCGAKMELEGGNT